MRRLADWLVLSMILFAPSARAEDAGPADVPDLELLEFLGEWETEDGEWIDPTSFEEPIELDVVGQDKGPKDE